LQFIKTAIPDLYVIEPRVFKDQRGYFMESFQKKLFEDNGIAAEFVQDNISFSVKGTLRGLHYQLPPDEQGKLVRVTQGSVFDVAVDIRRDSPSFGRWFGLELSEENKKAMYIPPGFAHGFYVLTDTAQFTYKCTAYYSPKSERGIIWNDMEIGVEWPLSIEPIISAKDLILPALAAADITFTYLK
jgi:dTDP-4-dehydrorhamnose 3,5-epimerase